jgi:serine phosphatase RsbU (regulator of sigma subunit)
MKKINDWFIGDYLAKTEDVFERAKITLTYHFAVFFLLQAFLFYSLLIINHLWYHLCFTSIAVVSMAFMLYVIKVKHNIKLASLLWLLQFIIIGTGTMLIQGAQLDMMSGFWVMVELLFAYFTLGNKLGTIALIHVSLQLWYCLLNELKYGGKLLELGIPEDQKLPNQPFFLLVPFILCIYIITKFVKTRSQAEDIVNDQKIQLENKNKEITDSINYARYIQHAILPSQEFIKSRLPESFVVYIPKSIVSGDFYWIQEKDGKIFFAVGDCTGHGVPGAILSVIAQNILNNAVITFNLDKPSEILDKASELMEQTLAQGGGQMRDGMDIALCSFDSKTMTLEYSGANNPLYIISDNELKEFKASKKPVGRYETKNIFGNNIIQVKRNDSIYLFSDGIADQFGGPNKKKFKYKALKDLLLAVCNEPANEQKNAINNAFVNWKGNIEQVDDICILGLKI